MEATLASTREDIQRRARRAALCRMGRFYIRYVPTGRGKRRLVGPVNAALREQARPFRTRVPKVGWMEGRTDDLIHRYLYLFGVWEPHVTNWLRNRLRPGDVFVDVGSHTGYYALLASRLVGPNGRVVAIEASPSIFRKLQRNLARNDASNVRAINMAATASAREVSVFEASDRNTGKTTIVPDDALVSRHTVRGAPLAEILADEELSMARVIKIDVEGAEAQVVEGLAPALARLRPDADLAIEVHSKRLARQGITEAAILDPLAAEGFQPYRIRNSYKAPAYLDPIEWPEPWSGPLRGEAQLLFTRL